MRKREMLKVNERLIIPVPVFLALLFSIVLVVAVAAYITPIEAGANWQGVFWGITNAIFVATLGYLKVTKPENFDPAKFLVTVVIGAISGYMAFGLGWTQEAIAAWFVTTGIIVWTEYGLKTFVRRLSTI